MNRRLLGLVVAFMALLVPAARAGDLLDRVVATVNGHIILQSDWEDAVHYAAFVDGHSLDQLNPSGWKAALDQLIDQELLAEQVPASDFRRASDAEVAQRIEEIRKQYADAASAEAWHVLLGRYGFTEASLKRHVSLQIDLTQLVDDRLRPNVTIDPTSIESYYNQELLPQLRQAGAKEVALADVRPKIKELLTEQKVNQLLVAWLQNLRAGSEIRTEPTTAEPQGEMQ